MVYLKEIFFFFEIWFEKEASLIYILIFIWLKEIYI